MQIITSSERATEKVFHHGSHNRDYCVYTKTETTQSVKCEVKCKLERNCSASLSNPRKFIRQATKQGVKTVLLTLEQEIHKLV